MPVELQRLRARFHLDGGASGAVAGIVIARRVFTSVRNPARVLNRIR
jgi:hypothetical protein